jgi:hypothetical protein
LIVEDPRRKSEAYFRICSEFRTELLPPTLRKKTTSLFAVAVVVVPLFARHSLTMVDTRTVPEAMALVDGNEPNPPV